MAKLKAPLMSLGASGALGKALVFFGWKGLNVVREYVVPANPKSTAQNTQRGYLTAAVAAVHQMQSYAAHPLKEDDVIAYSAWGSTFSTPRTWFNQAVKNWIDQKVAGLLATVFGDGSTVPGAGTLAVEVVQYAPSITAGNFKYGTSKTALIHTKAATVTTIRKHATIPALTTGIKYYWQFVATTPVDYLGVKSGIYYGVPA